MSAALLILPRLWATAAAPGKGHRLAVATAAITHRAPSGPFAPGRRKQPHSLRLVQAHAAPDKNPVTPSTPAATQLGALGAPSIPASSEWVGSLAQPRPAATQLGALGAPSTPAATQRVRSALSLVPARSLPSRQQPALHIYRRYTEAMLRRYLSMSLEAGRIPSLLGRDLFRGNVSHCTVTGFDDVVIFVEDVNKCLALLEPMQRFLVRSIAIEGFTQSETAAGRGLPLRSVVRRYNESLDRLSRLFLDRNLLQPLTDPD